MSEPASVLSLSAPVPVPARDMPVEIADKRETFTSMSREARGDETLAADQAFLASKAHLIRTHPTLHIADRDMVFGELTERLGRGAVELLEAKTGPVPGGVGYGVFYNTPFKTAFAQGTSLYFEIVCPTSPGGNVNNFLYLTAMNRSR